MRTWDEKRERRQRKDKATARNKERTSGPEYCGRERLEEKTRSPRTEPGEKKILLGRPPHPPTPSLLLLSE